MSKVGPTRWAIRLLPLLAVGLMAGTAWAQDAAEAVAEATAVAADAVAAVAEATEAAAEEPGISAEMFTVNNTWMMIATFLVFIMHLGFATLETGLTRAKNTVNILFKNTAIIAIGILTYTLIGFNLMYPGEWLAEGWLGKFSFGITNVMGDASTDSSAYNVGYTYWTDFLFQAMFAATAATIISGAVAERIKLGPFLIFATLYVAIVYPIYGSWKWGKGWLDAAGFYDFAGSTIVHSVGGWGALAGAIVLGPRIGKYFNGGGIKPIMGHSMPLATIGVFLLWLGWFGFNGGSVLSADPALVSYTLVTTSLAAASGIIGAIIISWTVLKKPDLSMALNGSLAGLVGITAGADSFSVTSAIIIGLIAGALVVFAVLAFDKIRIDDPVGAISVHLVCGIWGTLAVGIFSTNEAHSIVAQLKGIIAAGVLCFPVALGLFFLLKVTTGLRVSREEEIGGLDIGEHGMEAYSGFQTWTST
jgi:ammonium transporter, Amt family